MHGRVRRVLVERGGLVVLCVLAAYLFVAPDHITTGDNPEFATLSATGGAAHPTGYPLFIIWLRLWSWLPGSPAHASALATCLLGAASMLVLHAACRAWGASPLAASFAVAMAAASPLVLRVSTEAEVFALNGLVAGLVLWLAADNGVVRGAVRVLALALVAGLGLSDHVTCILIAPVGLWGVVRGMQETPRARIAVGCAAIGALIVGLLPYLYLLAVPETRGSWGKVDGLGGLLHHFLRLDYGGPGSLAARDHGGRPLPNIVALFGTLARAYLWAPFALGLGILAVRTWRRAPTEGTASLMGWRMLALSWLLAGPVLMSRFNLPPTDEHAYITRRFHILPSLVFCVPVAVGLDWIAAQLVRRLPARMRGSRSYVALFPALVVLTLIAVALPRITAARSRACERALQNMLYHVPQGAVIMGSSDEFGFGMGYLQGALHQREDVVTIMWPTMALAFARERVRRELGISVADLPPEEVARSAASVVLAREILATGRPLFIDGFLGNIARSFPVYPYGLLFRVLPPGSTVPTIDELFTINTQLFAKFVFDYPMPSQDDIVPAMFHSQYARVWQVIADGLGQAGRTAEQAQAIRMAFVLAPESE